MSPPRGNPAEPIKVGAAGLRQLIEAAGRHGSEAQQAFDMAVARSAGVLSPLGEPLLALDFIEHRWMASHREEVYSDWLQWIVAQMDTAEVLRVFGVEDPEMTTACVGCPVAIQREEGVKEGHEGFKGRLDLAIRIGEDSLLVVEVKLGAADQADTLKGKGYCRSIDAQNQGTRFRKYVILVIDASSDNYSGFRPRRWTDACIVSGRPSPALRKF